MSIENEQDIVIRKKKKGDYTEIDNTIIRDKNIDNEALGYFLRLWYLPPNWKMKPSGLKTLFNITQYSYKKLNKKLCVNGYLLIQQDRSNKGKFGINIWDMDDTGQLNKGVSTVSRNSASGFTAGGDFDTSKTITSKTINITTTIKEIAAEFKVENVDEEWQKFLDSYNNDKKSPQLQIKYWKQWCSQYQYQVHRSKQTDEKKNYRWDFKKAKDGSDRIKDWLEFEKGINWLDDFYLKDIPIQGIGWQEVQHPDFNKKEILLFRIENQKHIDDIEDCEIFNKKIGA